LDCITKTSITPDIFLHYIEKRLNILNASEEWLGDELDLFGAYLDCRLNVKNMPISSYEKFDLLTFLGYREHFERLAMFERGELDEKPEISLSIPNQVLELLQQLRAWNDYYARWIAFCLLDLEDKLLIRLADAISKIRTAEIAHDVFRKCTFANEEVVIIVVGSSSASFEKLKNHITVRAEIEKYRRKLNKSIGIGILCNKEHKKSIFANAQYIEYEWEENSDFENLIKDEPVPISIGGSKLPKRNAPCFCGSGIKYKKCCLRKIEASQNHKTQIRH
jgi:hypothetical protein